MRIWLLLIISLLPSRAFALDYSHLLSDFEIYTGIAVNAGRLVGFIMFGMAWYGIRQNAFNPNQYPLNACLWGMFSGLGLIMSGVLYTAFYDTLFDQNVAFDNSFIALNPSSITAITGTSGSSSILNVMMPVETMGAILAVMYFIGVLSFLKGIYIIKDAGKQNFADSGNSNLSKAIVHMIAGVFAMHFTKVGCALEASFGFGLFCVT